MTELRNGWHQVNRRTRLFVDKGKPIKVETTMYDVDLALDRAAVFWGAPLERLTPWLTDDGRNIEDEDCGNNSKITCTVEAQS